MQFYMMLRKNIWSYATFLDMHDAMSTGLIHSPNRITTQSS